MSDLKSSIRNALSGSSSQKPVDIVALYKLGKKADIDAALGELLANSEVNTAWTMKGGIQSTLYWLTGVVGPFKSPWQLNQEQLYGMRKTQATTLRQLGADEKVKPSTSIPLKEQPVNTSELRKTIYNKIVEHPGIKRDALIKHALQQCPEATEKQALKALSNLQHMAKKIRLEGERGNYTCHLNTAVNQPPAKPMQPAKSAKKPTVGKVVLGKEAAALRGDPAHRRVAKNVAKVAPATSVDPAFSVMLSDDNQLHIVSGDDQVILNQERIDRLHRFLTRIQPAPGARA